MRELRTLLLSFFLLLSSIAFSQSEWDVLRYSRNELHGTARYVGMAGAFGSLGADLSSIRANPAGIALFRKNELAFTPSFNNSISRSSFREVRASAEQFELAVEQIGGAFITTPSGPWESVHFGITYDRRRSFNEKIRIQNPNPEASILDRFVRISNGIPLAELNDRAPFTGEMAYQTYLMDPLQDSASYSHRLEGAEYGMEKELERSGHMGEAKIAVGVDRGDRLYYGISLGIPVVRFQRKTVHIETVRNGSDIRDLRYEENLNVRGSGMNLQAGAIYRPDPNWRFGLSAKSPSILYLREQWSTTMKADHGRGDKRSTGPVEGAHSYRIRTPYRLYGSAAYFIEKSGLIALEYRFSDHGSGKLFPSGNGYDYKIENQVIRNSFRPGHEFRIGAEWRLSPLYLRGGYALSTPARDGIEGLQEGNAQRYSIGAGYRKGGYFLDLAYRWSVQPELRRTIGPELGGTARIVHRMQGMVITGGARF